MMNMIIKVVLILAAIGFVVGVTFLGLYLTKTGPFAQPNPSSSTISQQPAAASAALKISADQNNPAMMAITSAQLADAVNAQKTADLALMATAETTSETALATLQAHDATILAAQIATDAANQVLALQTLQNKNAIALSEQIATSESSQSKASSIFSEQIAAEKLALQALQNKSGSLLAAQVATDAANQTLAVQMQQNKDASTLSEQINMDQSKYSAIVSENATLQQLLATAVAKANAAVAAAAQSVALSGVIAESARVTNWTKVSGINYSGNDIALPGNVAPTTAANCQTLCSNANNCVGALFNNSNNTCYPKSNLIPTSLVSADDVYVPSNLGATINGYDFSGNDISSIVNSSPSACRTSCQSTPNCVGGLLATDNPSNPSTPNYICYLKNKLIASSANSKRSLLI